MIFISCCIITYLCYYNSVKCGIYHLFLFTDNPAVIYGSIRKAEHMNITMLKSKIHRAVVTQAELNYVGSITVDSELLRAAGILEYELVQIVDIENGNRFETYTIAGEPGSGVMCLNGAAARQVQLGDHIILMCYASMTPEEAKTHTPKVVFVNDDNSISRITDYEKHGELFS